MYIFKISKKCVENCTESLYDTMKAKDDVGVENNVIIKGWCSAKEGKGSSK